MGSQSKKPGDTHRVEVIPPMELEVGMSRAEWLADVEVAVTSHTPDPLAGKHGDSKTDNG